MRNLEKAKYQGFDELHASFLPTYIDLVTELSGDADRLLHDSGITDVKANTSYRQHVALLRSAAEQLNCSDFGLRLATRQDVSTFGPLGRVMKNSTTYGDALFYASIHTYAHSLAARIRIERLGGDKGVFASHVILLGGVPDKRQAIEQFLMLGQLAALELTGKNARVRKVHFRHQPLSAPHTYRRYFGCEVLFGQSEDGVFFASHDLSSPIIGSDCLDLETSRSYVAEHFERRRPPIHAEVRGLIMRFIGARECSKDVVAAELNLHPRTLHRRLAMEGTSFKTIKNEVTQDLLQYYLNCTTMSIGGISERLGYAEQAVMTRNCQRLLSASPSAWRSGGEADRFFKTAQPLTTCRKAPLLNP
jgi:AraC-like DNA-binding protein